MWVIRQPSVFKVNTLTAISPGFSTAEGPKLPILNLIQSASFFVSCPFLTANAASPRAGSERPSDWSIL